MYLPNFIQQSLDYHTRGLEHVLSSFQRASHCVADLKPSEGQLDLDDVLRPGRRHDCVDVEANDPLYVLHTSGTTGGLSIRLKAEDWVA